MRVNFNIKLGFKKKVKYKNLVNSNIKTNAKMNL